MNCDATQESVIGRLLSEGLLDPSQLELARVEQQRTGGSLVGILLDLGLLAGEHLAAVQAAEAGLALADMARSTVCGPLAERIGPERVRRLKALPMVDPLGIRFVAMANPLDLPAVDEVRQLVGPEIEIRSATETDLLDVLERADTKPDLASNAIRRCLEAQAFLESSGSPPESFAPAETKGEGPLVDLVDDLVSQALDTGSSDLHFEPAETNLRVRFRRDGHLGGDVLIPKAVQSGVVARLKILGGLDVSESRSPQDGCGTVLVRRKRVHLRISTLPTQFGESVVLRLHPGGIEALTLRALGLDEGLDHAMLLRLGADPFVGENRHKKGIPDGARRGKGEGGLIPLCAPSPPPAGSHCRPQRWCRLSSPVRSQSARGSAVRRLWARCPTGPRRRRAGSLPPRRSGCG